MNRLIGFMPSIITMITLASGLAAIEATRSGNLDWALRLILFATVADGLDGALARHLKSFSSMGEQLDSLADIVAFGAAPALLFVTVYSANSQMLAYGTGLLFVLFAAYRLARFHAYPADGVFLGLPITAGGALLALIAWGPFGIEYWLATALAMGTAILMVCRVPFPKLSRIFRPQFLFLMAILTVPILLWPGTETVAIAAAIFAAVYVVYGLISRVITDDDLAGIGVEDAHEPSQQAR